MPCNIIVQEGWVTSAPEVKQFESGALAVNFSISIYTGQKKEDGTRLNKFMRVRFAGKPSDKPEYKSLVELAKDIKEGDRIVVTGKMEHFVWKNKKNNEAEELAEYIYGDSFRVFDHNEPKAKTDSKGLPKATAEDFGELLTEDDIPF